MKQNLIYVFIILILASCASTKTTAPIATPVVAPVTPVGNWDYLVTGTPDGDFKGVLAVSSSAGAFSAKMISATGEVPVEKFTFIKETNKITGEVPYNGMVVGLDATLAGDQLKGAMFAGGMDFPFSATRKK